jgi:HSP20 family protein
MKIARRNTDWLLPNTVDSFFDKYYADTNSGTRSAFVPKTDIAETDNEFEIQLAVPGMRKEDFKVDLNNGLLTISGERKFDKEETGKNFYSIQTEYGNFSKSFQLPEDVVAKKIEAAYESGILNVIVPKDKSKKLTSEILVK